MKLSDEQRRTGFAPGSDDGAVARVTLITLVDGRKAKVIRAVSESWIVGAPDGMPLYEHPILSADERRDLLAMAFFMASRGDEDAYMMPTDFERAVDIMTRIAEFDPSTALRAARGY